VVEVVEDSQLREFERLFRSIELVEVLLGALRVVADCEEDLRVHLL